MKLTIVIVNYNVRYFLEQCLLSVEKAIAGIKAEVFVVDNNSVDGSVEMVRQKFSWVTLIANQDNPGFSKANNQAMHIARGEYVLLLNPDTVVQEDTFSQVIHFMDEHPDAGGLGVKMVDGRGNYLPESKRGLPTPETAFYKIFGLNAIFRRSEKFNRYYLGHLSSDEVNEIEILSGAFMLMRKVTLDRVGLLDEAFFMYGEDIDLSWRIIQGGYKNYYYPHTRIIHYKGESTKKGSLNYVFVFYNAMVIFARKHFSEKNARLFSIFINIAIWLRAGVAIVMRFFKQSVLPVSDAFFTFTGLLAVKEIYAESQHKIYDDSLTLAAFSSYVLTWVACTWIGGSYDKPLKPLRVFKPLLIGSAIILICYSLLPEYLRFSRALILLGTIVACGVFFITRVIANLIASGKSGLVRTSGRRFAVVGAPDEVERVKKILGQLSQAKSEIIAIDPKSGQNQKPDIGEIVRVHRIEQVIFCARDISSADIISAMSNMDDKHVEFKIAPPESLYIIGSGSIETSADAFMVDVNSVSLPRNKRIKRIFDMIAAVVALVSLPILLFVVKKPLRFVLNIIYVLAGKKSWVGFHASKMAVPGYRLPRSKPGVLSPADLYSGPVTDEAAQKMNVVYAKDYRIANDLRIMWKAIGSLGN